MMKITEKLETLLSRALRELEIHEIKPKVEPTADLQFGDYVSNVALVVAKDLGKNPKDLAAEIVVKLVKIDDQDLERVEVAGPGFINFYLSKSYLKENLAQILEAKENYGKNNFLAGQRVMVEYTDPNPFKLFHIGHLMSNTIGESLSRLIEFSGAEVKRACYQGDVGMHVAKAIWGVVNLGEEKLLSDYALEDKIKFLGEAYVAGAQVYDSKKEEMAELNRKIYGREDDKIDQIYDEGRKVSLEYFEGIYQKLGTKFDFYFFESETGKFGKELVEEWLGKGIFTKSEGAVIFRGENYGTHTRVFLNSEGLPTYEAKELGLAKTKYEKYPYDLSVVITGSEVNDYFKVLLSVLKLIFPELAIKTKHLGHGMLRLPTGKMSSRTGEVITAEELIDQVKENLIEKIGEREYSPEDRERILEAVSVAALKYSILKQDVGRDIIFDFEKSLSFEGASGPYLQYAYVRTQSILEKKEKEADAKSEDEENSDLSLEKKLEKFPLIVERAARDYAPQYVCTYLVELASLFNSYYATWKIIGSESESYRLALVEAVGQTLENGLWLLGIGAPSKM